MALSEQPTARLRDFGFIADDGGRLGTAGRAGAMPGGSLGSDKGSPVCTK